MRFQQLPSLILLSGTLAVSALSLHAQQGSAPQPLKTVLPVQNGKVMASFRGQNIAVKGIDQQLSQLLDLPSGYTFTEDKTNTDQLGYTHTAYQQYYKGVKVDGGTLLVHSKSGILQSINGRVANVSDVSTTAAFGALKAAEVAMAAMDVKVQFRAYQSPLVIVNLNAKKSDQYTLAYKVRVDGRTNDGHVIMKQVYIDAASGAVLKTVNLIAHQDVNATAQTFLSGTQNIVVDSVGPHYRLKDNLRNIITMDATGSEMDQNAPTPEGLFPQAKEYHDQSLVWSEKPAIMSIRLSTLSSTSSLFNNVGWGSGRFPMTTVISGDLNNMNMAAWPDIKFNTTFLPLVSRNLFVFTQPDTTYTGVFAKVNLFSGDVTDTVAFTMNPTGTGTFPWSDTSNNSGNYVVANVANPALDAHWGIEKTFDYYQSVFNRTSYDNNGGKVINYMNGVWPSALTQMNAAAMPSPYNSMVYGLGDGATTNPFVAIDVTGHEFTHMVVEHNGHGGLEYSGESGALNESFADIFGTCVEFYAKPSTANWTIGEEVYIGNNYMRSMANPKLRQNPNTYEGQYWIDPTDLNTDNGGVHYNSGIQNKWFYLLCEGGSGTNDNGVSYNVTAIGMEKAEKIAYRNLTQYLTDQSDYWDAYAGSLQATLDLYASDTNAMEYKMVKEAWYAVGLGGANQVSIRNVDLANEHINVYPNPASNDLNINSSLLKPVEMHLVNALGQQMMVIQVKNGSNNFNVSQLSKGVYTLNFVVDGKSYMHKIAIQ